MPALYNRNAGLNKLVNDYRSKDVYFISFARNDIETLKDFLQTTEFGYKVVSSEFNLQEKYCIMTGWPTNIVIDRRGIVQLMFSGAPTDDTAGQRIYNKIKLQLIAHYNPFLVQSKHSYNFDLEY